jgi:hypothetical protein
MGPLIVLSITLGHVLRVISRFHARLCHTRVSLRQVAGG